MSKFVLILHWMVGFLHLPWCHLYKYQFPKKWELLSRDTLDLGIGKILDIQKLLEIEQAIFEVVTWSRFRCEQICVHLTAR